MKPFLLGKAHLGLPGLHLPGANATRSALTGLAPKGGACTAAEPSVETVKEGDKVVRLIITCGCGERIEIECIYSAGG
jgi:hypothetical protein